MEKKDYLRLYFWRITASHVIAYCTAGLTALFIMDYQLNLASGKLSQLFEPVTELIVALGPCFQILYGVFIGLVLIPFRKVFLNERFGAIKLFFLQLGISCFPCIAPASGSFKGLIDSRLAFRYQLLGLPEALVYAALFAAMAVHWNRTKRRIYDYLAIVAIAAIVILPVLSFLRTWAS